MARIMAVGSARWSDHRRTIAALRKVMTVYRDPYTLVCDMTDGAPRFAAAAARQLGWDVEAYELDPAKCAKDCPPEHRKPGGPTGDWCPSAAGRNRNRMLDSGVDLVVAFTRPGHSYDQGLRAGQFEARRRDVGIWTIEQPRKQTALIIKGWNAYARGQTTGHLTVRDGSPMPAVYQPPSREDTQ